MNNNLITNDNVSNLSIKDTWDLYEKYVNPGQVKLISSFGFGRVLVDHAEGMWIYTKDGKKILDFTGGVGVLNHGHNHPRILAARIKYQKNKSMEVHKNYFSPSLAALAHNIASILPGDLNKSYFPNSGAEAVEGALKMAYKYHNGKRKSVLYANISFHGKLHATASITGSPELSFTFPQIPNNHAFEYNNIDSVKDLVSKLRNPNGESDIYTIIIEPLNASSLRKCSKEFLLELRKICDENDIVLIFDEIYTGWSKTGELFYFMNYDLIPDILTMSKSFGGGKASIACYVSRDHIFNQSYGNLNDATLHSTTFNGFGEETTTAIEALNIIIEDNYVAKSKKIFELINSGLKALQQKYPKLIKEVRGSGALNGILFNADSKLVNSITNLIPSEFFSDPRLLPKVITSAVINELYDKHNILTFYGSNIEIPLIISPAIIVEEKEIQIFLDRLDETLSKGFVTLVLKFVKSKFFKK